AGRRHGGAVVIGGGRLHLDGEALVALLEQIGGAAADRVGVVVGRRVPGIAHRVVALAGACRRRQRLAFLRDTGDDRRGDRGGGIERRSGCRAGDGVAVIL